MLDTLADAAESAVKFSAVFSIARFSSTSGNTSFTVGIADCSITVFPDSCKITAGSLGCKKSGVGVIFTCGNSSCSNAKPLNWLSSFGMTAACSVFNPVILIPCNSVLCSVSSVITFGVIRPVSPCSSGISLLLAKLVVSSACMFCVKFSVSISEADSS